MKNNKIVVGIIPTYKLTNEANDPYQDRASFVRMYEPWHIRYVGSKIFAKKIMDNNLTLEEMIKEVKHE